jgi:predicted hydrolase (HD superfamily)
MRPMWLIKKITTPAFAAAVDRDEMRRAAEELRVDFDEHVAKVIAAMEERSTELGLDGQQAPQEMEAPVPRDPS